jgi:hypothetical protein
VHAAKGANVQKLSYLIPFVTEKDDVATVDIFILVITVTIIAITLKNVNTLTYRLPASTLKADWTDTLCKYDVSALTFKTAEL